MKNTHTYFIILLLGLLFTSCVSSKKMVYFQPIEGASINDTLVNFQPTITQGDLLKINVAALDPEAAVAFNLMEYTGNGAGKALDYLVTSTGEINFPILGTIQVVGLSTKELTDNLVKQLSEYIVNPVVNIRYTNFKVTVLGEVNRPGTYTVENGRISIIEALGLAGDLTIQGRRDNLLLLREQNGKIIMVPIDLTSVELFNSPYYYLAQNDVIYIEPNRAKINTSVVGANTSVIFSSISTLISIIAILTR